MKRQEDLRRALRRSEPEVLATILLGQLVAYRCSTIYAPSVTRLDAFVRELVLPRLREQLDVRTVVVERWDRSRGPTLRQLVEEIHRQLGIPPGPGDDDPASLAGLDAALRRAERRSERPLLLVLYRLEGLLDAGRDPAEVARLIDALAHVAEKPMTGLHLVLGVQEQDLGAFRELLRGRWRLLAHDIRIRPAGKRWVLPIPLVLYGFLSTHTVVVAGATGACVAAGAAAGVTAGSLVGSCPECPACREAPPRPDIPSTREPVTPAPSPAAPPRPDIPSTREPVTPAPSPERPPPTTAPDEPPPVVTPVVEPPEPPPRPVRPAVCTASRRDGACARCVRDRCCAELAACKQSRWRDCVLKGRLGQDVCTPEALEENCRGLALCALENDCRRDCFNF